MMKFISDTAMIGLLNRSLTGGAIILAVLLLRLFMKRFPKKYVCLLWLIPFVRLLLPVSIPSPMSLVPVNAEALQVVDLGSGRLPMVQTGISAFDSSVNGFFLREMAPNPATSMDPIQFYLFCAKVIWISGLLLFLAVNLFRYFRLKGRLSTAIPAPDSGVYYSDQITMPLVAGIIKPGIYLPSFLRDDESKDERELILSHEQAHRERYDHLTKILAFAALAVHWFNPLVWAAFLFFCKDVEMACDERVMERLGKESKKEYSMALLHFEEQKSGLLIPLAFGESHAKSRIKNILNYKKPRFWVGIAAAVLLLGAAAAFLTSPDGPSVGIIGGADGPTSIFIAGKNPGSNSVSVIGGADGPTSIFMAGKNPGSDSEGADGGEPVPFDLEAAKKEPFGEMAAIDWISMDRIVIQGSFGCLTFDLSGNGEVYSAEFVKGYSPSQAEAALTELMESVADSDFSGRFAPAPVEEMAEVIAEKIGNEENSALVSAPVMIPEFSSEVYGFVAADGPNLEDLWYGIWHAHPEELAARPVVRVELFP